MATAHSELVGAKFKQLSEDVLESIRADYERDGAAIVRNVVPMAWIEALRAGTERLMANGVPDMNDYNKPGEGRFFGDIFAYLRTPEYRDFFTDSGVGELAARIMRSQVVRFFYDQPLVKEPGTPKPTPWHQDSAYWPCSGQQVMSVWVPLDAATPQSGVVSYVKGSHKWNAFYPYDQWSDRFTSDFGDEPWDRDTSENPGPGASATQLRTIADIRDHPEKYEFATWNVEPGDVLLHHMDTIHGAPGNLSQNQRRRAVAFRFFGDDARWDNSRPHFMRRMAKIEGFPYPQHETGDLITDPFFPVIFDARK
jgi:ectoine hydroxylase-related dioxygenase (phytanoyl-CoA dioxygenase family)